MSVIVYTSKTCPHCTTAKDWLRHSGIDFEERPLEDPNHYREFAKLHAQGVPTLVIDGEVLVGFSPDQVRDKLKFSIERCPSCKRRMKLPKHKGTIKVTCPHCEYPFTFQTKV